MSTGGVGAALSIRQQQQLENLLEAYDALLAAMHYADGSQPDAEQFGSRLMAIAATQVEMGMEMAFKAVLQQP